jgi:hypothetical protein
MRFMASAVQGVGSDAYREILPLRRDNA